MPVWLWIVLFFVVFVAFVALVWFSRLKAESRYSDEPSLTMKDGEKTGRAVLYVPGILAHGHKGLLGVDDALEGSLLEEFLRHGDVYALDYAPKRFVALTAVLEVRLQLSKLLKNYSSVVIVGASMGGMIAQVALRTVDETDRWRIRLVLVDSPSGAKSVKLGGSFMALSRFLDQFLPIGQGLFLGNLSAPSGPPKPDETQPDLDFEAVKRTANQRLSGFKVRVWIAQSAFIGGFRIDPRVFQGLEAVHYIACTFGNVNVRQPQACDDYGYACQEVDMPMYVHAVPMPHCGWMQQPKAARAVLGAALA